MGADNAGTLDSWYVTNNEQKNSHNNVIEVEIKREMTVETDKQYQETVEADANMLCQLKQRDDWLYIAIIFFISIKFMEVWMYQIRSKLRMCLATLC